MPQLATTTIVETIMEPVPVPVPEPPPKPPVVTLDPALVPVCACESTGDVDGTPTQFTANGKVVRSRTNDVGACQINLKAHNVEAKAMGIDLLSEIGNIMYANYLYVKEGFQPWSASRACWSKEVASRQSQSGDNL